MIDYYNITKLIMLILGGIIIILGVIVIIMGIKILKEL